MESAKGDLSSFPTSSSFPFGLHILVVDDDPTCLMVVERMLKKCRYEVTTCEHATIAVSLLRERRGRYDIVLTDVHMPDMDGFKLLEIVGLEMDLPVVMMSADSDVNVAKRGLEHGACYYLMKPISLGEIRNIWQHLVRKKMDEKRIGQISSNEKFEEDSIGKKSSEDGDCASTVNEENSKKQRKRKNEAKEDEDSSDDEEEEEENVTQRKPRITWHSNLHTQFLNAVDKIGIERAVPKKILELMDVPGLTRENVASHLQKYRLFLRKLNDANLSHRSLPSTFAGKFKSSMASHHMMMNYRGQMGNSKFSNSRYNAIGLGPGVVDHMKNLNASMPLTSMAKMPPLNCPANVRSLLLPGSNSVGPRPAPPQQNSMTLGFGMVPQHVKTGPSSLVDTMPMTQQKIQTSTGPSGSGPFDNIGLMNVQNNNCPTNMGNVVSINSVNQPPPFNNTSNYSGLHLTSSGDLYGMNQTRPLGQAPSNISSGYNVLIETNKGKMPLDMDAMDSSSDPFNKLPIPDKISASFPIATEGLNHLVVENSLVVEGDSLSDILKSSTIGSTPQPFDIDLDDLIFNQQRDGFDPMDSDFDISEFQMDGSGNEKGAAA